jgi:hypothetical protein
LICSFPPSGNLRPISVEFYEKFHYIKYVDLAKRECESFMGCEESFIIKLL